MKGGKPFSRAANKYRAVRTEHDGRTYASKAEALRAAELDALKAAGVIRHWEPQPRFRLGCAENVYVADFLVWPADRSGPVWVEEVKGRDTSKFRRDLKLWARYGPCDLLIYRRGRLAETITPGGAEP